MKRNLLLAAVVTAPFLCLTALVRAEEPCSAYPRQRNLEQCVASKGAAVVRTSEFRVRLQGAVSVSRSHSDSCFLLSVFHSKRLDHD
jgi:hypothetical protein